MKGYDEMKRVIDTSTEELFPGSVLRTLDRHYSPRQLQNISLNIITPPQTTIRVNTLVSDVESVLNQVRSLLSQASIYKYHEEHTGTKINYYELVRKHPVLPDLITIDKIGPCENSFDEKLPCIWIDRKCAEAVIRGANAFAPGVKGAQAGVQRGSRVNVLVDVDNRLTKGCVQVHTGQPNATGTDAAIMFLGVGLAHMSRDELFGRRASRHGVAVEILTSFYIVAPPFADHLNGLIYPQNLPSVLVTHVLDPQPGERVLDMCASPGGKTSHIAARMQNTGIIVAMDKSDAKVRELEETLARLHVGNTRCFRMDATNYRRYIIAEDEQSALEYGNPLKLSRESFDRILVDPSCSGLGMRPRLRHESLTAGQLEAYPKHQINILRAAVMLAKVGGVIVYSTCTLNPEENELVVSSALRQFPLKLECPEDSPLKIGAHGLIGGTGLRSVEAQGIQRFDLDREKCFPDCSAFFCARFRKLRSFR